MEEAPLTSIHPVARTPWYHPRHNSGGILAPISIGGRIASLKLTPFLTHRARACLDPISRLSETKAVCCLHDSECGLPQLAHLLVSYLYICRYPHSGVLEAWPSVRAFLLCLHAGQVAGTCQG